jgi:transcriptional regulator
MYIPRAFEVEDRTELLNFIRNHSFGILITSTVNGPTATHLPFYVESNADNEEDTCLLAHMAKANPHWTHHMHDTQHTQLTHQTNRTNHARRAPHTHHTHQTRLLHRAARTPSSGQIAAAGDALVVFQGPHTYISPTWYETPDMVPTWNYTAVHVYGELEFFDDPDQLIRTLERLTDHYESALPNPWKADFRNERIRQLLTAIIGIRIRIRRIEGQFKLNQNHPAERRQKVAAALQRRNDPNAQAIAGLMRRSLPSPILDERSDAEG